MPSLARGQTLAPRLYSFTVAGQAFHTHKAMIHVEFQDPGYLSLYCFNGLHIYINGQCIHCDRPEPKTATPRP